MVPKTREDFPDPETPVKTVSRRLGMSSEMSARLFSRAPRTSMTSWLSAANSMASMVTLNSLWRVWRIFTQEQVMESPKSLNQRAKWRVIDLARLGGMSAQQVRNHVES